MFSYLKYLDISDEKISFTFFGDFKKINELHKIVKKNYLNFATIIIKKMKKIIFLYVKNRPVHFQSTILKNLMNIPKKIQSTK